MRSVELTLRGLTELPVYATYLAPLLRLWPSPKADPLSRMLASPSWSSIDWQFTINLIAGCMAIAAFCFDYSQWKKFGTIVLISALDEA